eukprot:6207231-Pleurochrysis_carterae.AAC.3
MAKYTKRQKWIILGHITEFCVCECLSHTILKVVLALKFTVLGPVGFTSRMFATCLVQLRDPRRGGARPSTTMMGLILRQH